MNITGIIFLISVFLIINVIYKNVINIVTFLVSYVIMEQFVANKYTAVLIAYVIGIGVGIIRNFHLLENFEIKNNNEKEQSLDVSFPFEVTREVIDKLLQKGEQDQVLSSLYT